MGVKTFPRTGRVGQGKEKSRAKNNGGVAGGGAAPE